MDPKVSVIMPVYNAECYGDGATPSILAQTFIDFELILIDDGSTDATPGILDRIARTDERVRVLSPGRLGFSNALNYGASAARGEYLARQDYDDWSYPCRLAAQVAFLDAHPEVGVVGGHYVVADALRRERYLRKPPESHSDLVRTLARCTPFAETTVTVRKTAWADSGGYPNLGDVEDHNFWINMAGRGWRLGAVPVALGEHRVHAESFWHRNRGYRSRQKKVAEAQRRAIREMGLPKWMYVYPLTRSAYIWMPTCVKRFVRRRLAGTVEEDLGRPCPVGKRA